MNTRLRLRPILLSVSISWLITGCSTAPVTPTRHEYKFDVSVASNGKDLVIKPSPAQPGLYEGGHARIRLNKKDEFHIAWQCTDMNPATDISIETMNWDDTGTRPPDKGELNDKPPNHSQNTVDFDLSKKNAGKRDIAVYKYTLKCGAGMADPVIIIDR